ncbi:hypothetical protein SK128_007870, partial [Halocaridina rubra]
MFGGQCVPFAVMERQQNTKRDSPTTEQPTRRYRRSRKRPIDYHYRDGESSSAIYQASDAHQWGDFSLIPVCPAARFKTSMQRLHKITGSNKVPHAEEHQEMSSLPSSPDVTAGGASCCGLLDSNMRTGESSHSRNTTTSPENQQQRNFPDAFYYPTSLIDMFNRSCHLQYEPSPLKITRARFQYMYDDANREYIDCVNSVAH